MGHEPPTAHAVATGDAAARAGHQLSDRERALLDFERQWWRYAGSKEQAVRDLFDMSSTRYYQVLNALIDRDEALDYDPMLVKRLRRMRASRQRTRTARRLGLEV
jgi:flavin-dependent dehydrogenase